MRADLCPHLIKDEDYMPNVLLLGADEEKNRYEGIDIVSLQDADNEGNLVNFVYEHLASGLPTPTPEDNGKLLGVVDEQWQIVDAPLELPSISQDEDNGKILQVVNNSWSKVVIPEQTFIQQNADWNQNNVASVTAIRNRPFGTINKETVIFEDTIEATPHPYDPTHYYCPLIGLKLTENIRYKLEVTCEETKIFVEQPAAPMEDFVAIFSPSNPYVALTWNKTENHDYTILLSDFEGEYEIKLTQQDELIEKLDPVYLPDEVKLPEITDDDDGKFLQVVGGSAAWVSLQSAEEATF